MLASKGVRCVSKYQFPSFTKKTQFFVCDKNIPYFVCGVGLTIEIS